MLGFGIEELNIFSSILVCLISGFLISLTLKKCNQRWSQTFHNSVTFVVLPVITYVITTVIQNNIALSLGMVGALSIVRFRHPVKNPLELVIYFALITVGISSGVNLKFTIILTTIIVLVIVTYYIYFYKLKRNNQNFSTAYFEGENGITMEIETKEEINDLVSNNKIIEIYADTENKNFIYRLFFLNMDEAKNFYKNNLDNKSINKIKYTSE